MSLELVPTDELVAELEGRFDICCIVAAKELTEKTYARTMYWRCKDFSAAIGLLAQLQHRLIHQMEKDGRKSDHI